MEETINRKQRIKVSLGTVPGASRAESGPHKCFCMAANSMAQAKRRLVRQNMVEYATTREELEKKQSEHRSRWLEKQGKDFEA